MDAKANQDIWAQGRRLPQDELDEDDRRLFTSQLDTASPTGVVKSLEKQQEQAQNEYTTHSLRIKDNKIFDFNVGSIVKRFSILCRMVDPAMTFAPDSAAIVWTTFRFLTRFLLEDQELCEFLTSALDRISDAILACGIFAHRYFQLISEAGKKIREAIPNLYKTFLRFSFETKKLLRQDDEKRPLKKVTRSLEAAFGKGKQTKRGRW